MEIIVIILWYLNLLIPGQQYSLEQVDNIAVQNQPAVQVVQADANLTTQAVEHFNNTWQGSNTSIIEWWDENPIKQIPD